MNAQVQFAPKSEPSEVWDLLNLTLPEEIFAQLEKAAIVPYESDFDILRDYQMLHLLRELLFSTRSGYLRNASTGDTLLKVSLPDRASIIRFIDEQAKTYANVIERRYTATKTKNGNLRFVRLVDLLEFTDLERGALAYLVNATIDDHPLAGYNYDHNLKALRNICGLTVNEIMWFLDDERIHMQQGVIHQKENTVYETLMRSNLSLSIGIMALILRQDSEMELDIDDHDNVLTQLVLDEVDRGTWNGPAILLDIKCEPKEGETDKFEPPAPDSDFDLHDFLSQERQIEKENGSSQSISTEKPISGEFSPYIKDREYLNDQFLVLVSRSELKNVEDKNEDFLLPSELSKSDQVRIARAKMNRAVLKVKKRLQITRENGDWLPRLERLAEKRGFDDFEKNVILLLSGLNLMSSLQKEIKGSYSVNRGLDVEDILNFFVDSFEENIRKRRYFYRNAKLVAEGVIELDGNFTSDILDYTVSLDQKILEYIAGLDLEPENIVEGSNLYTPQVNIDQVVLPEGIKLEIIDLAKNGSLVEKLVRKDDRFGTYSTGRGTIMLFYGEPGTGKTMMANALANHLGKKVLLVNYPSLGAYQGDKVIRYLKRLAKVHDAILVFDECESLFISRDRGVYNVNVLLTEFERYDGIIILATNRAYDMDRSMESRMSYRFEFNLPNMHQREKIWEQHIPVSVELSDDVDLSSLAMRYEFSGRFIKNSVKGAISRALRKGSKQPVLTRDDLEWGAQMQLQGHLRRANLESTLIPQHGLERVVLREELLGEVRDIIRFEKAKPILENDWDFKSVITYGYGNIILFYGPPGTGKTMTAEAIGYETGCPLKKVKIQELLSKYVGETAKNIEAVFKEAAHGRCILVIEDSEGMLGGRTSGGSAIDKHANMDTAVILEHLERFQGMVIMTTNNPDFIDKAIRDRVRYKLEFTLPDKSLRAKIWRGLIPGKAPVAGDIDFDLLASKFAFNGRSIKNCVLKAATKAAIREEKERYITMADFMAVAELENSSGKARRIGF
jgi:AAA+ superfamily predicted ATPase